MPIYNSPVSDGFSIKLPVEKNVLVDVTALVIPITGGSKDNTISYNTSETITYHTKNIVQSTTDVIQQSDIKYTANASLSVIGDGATGSGSVGYASEYLDKIEQNLSTTLENAKDETYSNSLTIDLNYNPNEEYTIYQVMETVNGEYSHSYLTGKQTDSSSRELAYHITVDYSRVPQKLYSLIGGLNVGADTGEWSTFNGIASTAFDDLDKDIPGTWKKFLTDLSSALWTDGDDQSSWTIIKTAAHDALNQSQPIDQLRVFSKHIQGLTNPSHNDWAWEAIISFTSNYAF